MQARARRTRERILAQAQLAFGEHGFEATNLTEHILAPAGVSVGSFYHQFENKREVLLELISDRLIQRQGRVIDELQSPSHRNLGDSYRAALGAILDDVEANPDAWHIQWRELESPDPVIRAAIVVGLDQWIEVTRLLVRRWYPSEHPNFKVAAHLVLFMSSGLARDYAHATPEARAERREGLIEAATAFCEAGVGSLLTSPTLGPPDPSL